MEEDKMCEIKKKIHEGMREKREYNYILISN